MFFSFDHSCSCAWKRLNLWHTCHDENFPIFKHGQQSIKCVCFSPPARWGSLDFIRVASASSFLLLLRQLCPQLRAPELSGHCRTSTASARCQWACRTSTRGARSQWALPDPNCEGQMSVALPDLSQTPERMSNARIMQDRMPERMSG